MHARGLQSQKQEAMIACENGFSWHAYKLLNRLKFRIIKKYRVNQQSRLVAGRLRFKTDILVSPNSVNNILLTLQLIESLLLITNMLLTLVEL